MRIRSTIFCTVMIFLSLSQEASAQRRGPSRTADNDDSDKPSSSSSSSSSSNYDSTPSYSGSSSSSSSSTSDYSGSSYSGSNSSSSSSTPDYGSSSSTSSSTPSYDYSSTYTTPEPRPTRSAPSRTADRDDSDKPTPTPSTSSNSSTTLVYTSPTYTTPEPRPSRDTTSSRPARTPVSSNDGPAPRPSRDTSTSSTPSTRPPVSSSTGPAPRPRVQHTGSTASRPPVSSSTGPAPRWPRSPYAHTNPGNGRPSHHGGRVLVRRDGYHHIPGTVHSQLQRYRSPRDYHVSVRRYHIYQDWIQEPVEFYYNDGYWDFDNYPYYVDNGYRYRYSRVDQCQYDLVDGNDYTVFGRTDLVACKTAYDRCAIARDTLNQGVGMERYFCAESVDTDLRVSDGSEYFPLPNTMSETKRAAIEEYLRGMSKRDIYNDGRKYGVGECSIVKLRGNAFGCNYMVQVGSKFFPDPKGSVCAKPERAALIGCREEGQKNNAGCILEKAILEGYCH